MYRKALEKLTNSVGTKGNQSPDGFPRALNLL